MTSGGVAGNPTVTPGAVTISPAGIPSGGVSGLQTVSTVRTVTPTGIGPEERFGRPGVTQFSPTQTVSPYGLLSGERAGYPALTQIDIALEPILVYKPPDIFVEADDDFEVVQQLDYTRMCFLEDDDVFVFLPPEIEVRK
jgi:hypothetical protein